MHHRDAGRDFPRRLRCAEVAGAARVHTAGDLQPQAVPGAEEARGIGSAVSTTRSPAVDCSPGAGASRTSRSVMSIDATVRPDVAEPEEEVGTPAEPLGS
ncbi:hypothetical protein [Blastococcus saxobsidens]|uniref:Uncharacterized protein n=1 Tax=Blastococcus saxobsidens TaxID=138336 RepID=A0A4Q7Y8W4_9ACTN|nr:hypothetical protein [Blastococcus saxobsidens]RZU32465.1 hypothetical protein BKA19_2160 [Blastococcus saxobsidens]